MFIFDCIKYAFKGLLSKKSRFILTVTGILVGITSITIISTIGTSGKAAVVNEFDVLGLNGASIRAKKVFFYENELSLLKEKFENKAQISAMIKETAKISCNNKKYDAVVWGGEEDLFKILNLQIMYGREIRKKDVEERKNIIILTENISEKLFGITDSVGKTVDIETDRGAFSLVVAGITKTGDMYDMISDNVPAFVYIPYTTFYDAPVSPMVNEICIASKNGNDVSILCEEIINALGNDDNYYYENMNIYKKSINDVLDIVSFIVTLIGLVSLIVGGISVMNIMLITVNERKKEIGIKKAIGFNNNLILTEFLFEALIIIVISCILGIASGLLISNIIVKLFGIEFSVDVKLISKMILLSSASALVFGMYPAYKASKIDPVKCL